ncbi:MAG: hypothetical protein HC898_11795 [Phycisphaerales bacterium]|nr:hypothetical protein [Phycisphaerales bacterium]
MVPLSDQLEQYALGICDGIDGKFFLRAFIPRQGHACALAGRIGKLMA